MGGKKSARRVLLTGLSVLVLVASADPSEIADSPAVVAAVDRQQAPVARAGRDTDPGFHGNPHADVLIDLSKLTREKSQQAARDPFAPRSFYTAPPRRAPTPQTVPVVVNTTTAPTAPTAPPLPFTYMGRMTDDPNRPIFFLVKSGNLYNVRLGEVIEGTYRVESVVGSSLRLIYLPLDIEQLLSMEAS